MSTRAKRQCEEAEAKIHALEDLEDQAKEAGGHAKSRIDERIAEIRGDDRHRLGKLEQARKLTPEALPP